jgi:enoyl-CoA hydratase
MAYETLIIEQRGAVALVRLNRPHALNALNKILLDEFLEVLARFNDDDSVDVVVLTGNEKAFAAGADIKEMKDFSYMDAYLGDHTSGWDKVTTFRKPLIAAVAGFALGGGCEVALMCDFIIAADTAKFGQPEITLGVIPGMGGTQRLTRAVGKAKAMDMVLTGRMIDAAEAERIGMVARVVPADKLVEEAMAAAEKIASLSRPAVMMAKESVNRAFETTLAEGMRFERRMFHSLFATEDQKEGMAAFTEKRKPKFVNR